MNIPAELKYTKDHEWIRVEIDEVIIGITDFAQGELGDIVFVEVDTEGEDLAKEEVFGTVEAVKTAADYISGGIGALDLANVINLNPVLAAGKGIYDISRYCTF